MRVLVIATSRKTRGGITAVLKLYEQSPMWRLYHCRWIGTHRDGFFLRKVCYFVKSMALYVVLLPFYDIVHIHFSLATSAKRKYLFFCLAKFLGKKTVIHLHCGSQIDDNWSLVYQKMFEKCNYGIVLSESLKTNIEKYIGKSSRIQVIYNPCPNINYLSSFEKKHFILFSGTLSEGKGYLDLIRAFAIVADKFKDWKIILAGNGEVEKARSMALELGINDQVVLLGWVEGAVKHRVFCEASALCLPSYAEGFPMAVLDAWAYGLPVVTTPVGGVKDVAVDGINMLLFEPGDLKCLSQKLNMLMSDESLRTRLSKESKKMAAERFSMATVTDQVGVLYKSLLN